MREAKLATSTISDCYPFMPSLALQGSWASLLFLENPRCHRTQKTLRSQAGETEDLTTHRTQASLASACRFNRQPPGISNRKESLALLSTFLYLPGPGGGTLSSTFGVLELFKYEGSNVIIKLLLNIDIVYFLSLAYFFSLSSK